LSFQWRFNGANLAGATLSSYTRANAQYAHSGNYDIVVSNAYGVATSQLALLTVTLPPVLQTLWLDNFDANTAANWAMNRSSSDCRVTFNYDYAADGISSAPNSTNNTTHGVKLEANVSLATAAAINISPVGRSFSGDYRLRFDLWINQNGPFPAGGNGSTQHGTAGLGTAGNQVQWTGAGSTADGYWFAVDGEGQASDTSTSAMNDFGAFSGTTCHAASSGVYAAGTASNSRGNGNSYYAGTFPGGQTAPTSQQAAYSQQSGGLAAGTIGFAWRDVIINKTGNTVEWFIDGLRIATIPGATFTSSNIFIGLWDSFNSLSDNTNLSFAVFDNVRVERFVTNVPPYLTVQPQGGTNLAGASVTLSVTATGTAPLCYRWQCDGNAYPPGTNTFLACQAGDYSVVVSNVAGMVTSAVATVVFTNPVPALPGHFDSISRLADGSVQLNMSGTAGTNYLLEWTSDWVGWSNLCTLSSADGSLSWVDPCATNSNRRFYRLRLP
jgi:hypothetical protein